MISVWDFMFLEGWDWEVRYKGTKLGPGDSFSHKDLRVDGRSYPIAAGMFSFGHDDAKFTNLKITFDDREYFVSPFFLYTILGTWTGWLPSFFFVSRYSITTDQYAIGTNPLILIPCKKHFEIEIIQPRYSPITGNLLTGTVSAYVFALVFKITDEDLFMESLRRLLRGEVG